MDLRATALSRACTAGAVLLVTLLAAAPVRAAVLCGKKDTITGRLKEGASLRVRTVCKATEVPADLASLGLATAPHAVIRLGTQVSTSGTLSTPAPCEPGEVATGGGALATQAGGGEAVLRSSRPQPDTDGAVPTAWRVTIANTTATGTITGTAYAVCVGP